MMESPTPFTAASNFLLLKIHIPFDNTTKTVRIETKTRVWELQEKLKKKMSAEHQCSADAFGLFWHSDSGPLWLAEPSAIMAYHIKNGDTLEFKKRPLTLSRTGTVLPTATYVTDAKGNLSPRTSTLSSTSATSPRTSPLSSSSSTATSPRPSSSTDAPRPTAASGIQQMHRPTVTSAKMFEKPKTSWVSVRPASAYNMRTSADSSLSTPTPPSPTPSPTPSPRSDPSPRRPSSSSSSSLSTVEEVFAPPRSESCTSLEDLDGLIDSFDDITFVEDEAHTSPSPRDYTHSSTPTSTEFDATHNDNGSTSSFYNKNSLNDNHYTAEEERSVDTDQPSSFPSMDGALLRAQQQQQIETKVNMKVIETILADALSGIESGAVDMDMVKNYLTTALIVLRSM